MIETLIVMIDANNYNRDANNYDRDANSYDRR